jgi:predicted DNA-binding protein (MmcQ/YjbR family)
LGIVASHIDWLREFCLGLPHATEDVQWGEHLLFRIAGKIFCITSLEPSAPVKVCFKCTPEQFAELVEMEGIIPAPYMARNHWVAMEDIHALRQGEIKELIHNSYQLVFGRLSKRLQRELSGPAAKHRVVKSGSGPGVKAKSFRR